MICLVFLCPHHYVAVLLSIIVWCWLGSKEGLPCPLQYHIPVAVSLNSQVSVSDKQPVVQVSFTLHQTPDLVKPGILPSCDQSQLLTSHAPWPFQIKVSNLLGSSLGKVTVTADTARHLGDDAVVLSKKPLTTAAGDKWVSPLCVDTFPPALHVQYSAPLSLQFFVWVGFYENEASPWVLPVDHIGQSSTGWFQIAWYFWSRGEPFHLFVYLFIYF